MPDNNNKRNDMMTTGNATLALLLYALEGVILAMAVQIYQRMRDTLCRPIGTSGLVFSKGQRGGDVNLEMLPPPQDDHKSFSTSKAQKIHKSPHIRNKIKIKCPNTKGKGSNLERAKAVFMTPFLPAFFICEKRPLNIDLLFLQAYLRRQLPFDTENIGWNAACRDEGSVRDEIMVTNETKRKSRTHKTENKSPQVTHESRSKATSTTDKQ